MNNTEKHIRAQVKKILFEIHDYNKVDIDDLGDTYSGYVYFHSKEPVELSDIKNQGTIVTDLVNRADASGTDSEYIYRIKTKKPLYKEPELSDMLNWNEIDPFSDEESNKKPAINPEDFSGYFKYSRYSQEPISIINTADISNFKHIGGFRKYDKHYPERISDIELSEKTDSFLSSYIGGDIIHKPLTLEIWEELTPFRPTEPVKLYKGIEEVQIRHNSDSQPPYKVGQIIEAQFPHLTSWTTNPLIARRFIDDYPSSPPFVVEMVTKPENIVVDVQKLPTEYYHTNQREMILNKGFYKFKIVWAK
jgi:hypothetical protein